MAKVCIGPDGSIIKDDVVIESEERIIIKEDGTIDTAGVGGHSEPPIRTPGFAAPPVSPLDRGENRSTSVNPMPLTTPSSSNGSNSQPRGGVDLNAIKEKEYDIQVIDGRIKSVTPKIMIILTAVLCVLGAFGLYFFFIPAVVTGAMIFVGFSKKSKLKEERARMCEELRELEQGTRR